VDAGSRQGRANIVATVFTPRRSRVLVTAVTALSALVVVASCGSNGPGLTAPMKSGAVAIASITPPPGWTFQSTDRSSNVTVIKVNSVALDALANQGKVASIGWSSVSPTLTAESTATACQAIADRIEAARVATGAAPLEPGFSVGQCTTTNSPSNSAAASNQGRSVTFSACYQIDATHCMSATTAIEGGATDRQVLLALSVIDRGN